MFIISEDKLLQILQCFEELIDKDKSEELKKKREEWDNLEKALSDPFNEIDSNNSGTIEKTELEKYQ